MNFRSTYNITKDKYWRCVNAKGDPYLSGNRTDANYNVYVATGSVLNPARRKNETMPAYVFDLSRR